ncbi:DUF1266 domain-containing protein [Pseudomonas sp. LABIM340]|uniref:DUF1266 domain-containing protein n=1 Tax=Pseudomonas sp. LABIM340 TaxID=3156585 RepID=UPI0032AF837B
MMGWLLSGLTAMRALGVRVGLRTGATTGYPRSRRRKSPGAAGPEPLLCFGALLSHCEVGAGVAQADDRIELWGITDAATARRTLQELMLEAQSQTLEEEFRRLQRNEPCVFEGQQRLRYKQAKRAWSKAGLALPVDISMAAHDLESLAWLARQCHACGYLSEPETWLCLAWVAENAIRSFSDWQAYAASFVLGRAILLRDGASGAMAIRAFKELIGGRADKSSLAGLWRAHPLAGIRVSEVVLQEEHIHEPLAHPPCSALLALGCVIAHSAGVRADDLAIAPQEREFHRLWLAEHWRAADAGQVRARMDWLLGSGSREKLDPLLDCVADAPMSVGGTPMARFAQARRALLKEGHDPAMIDECRTVLAYDLERAAFGARLAFSVGLLDEESLWNALRHMARQARAAFDCWERYLVSLMLGHALANEDWQAGKRLLRSGMALLDGITPFAQYPSPWQVCPLEMLPVLHRVAPVACRGPGASYRT